MSFEGGIYTVTVLTQKNYLHRVWGYELTFEEAESKVLSNHSDLFEFLYTHAVIEFHFPGVPAGFGPRGGKKRILGWYKVEYDKNVATVSKCDCPPGWERCFNWAMG